jgi:hypothetical protein
MTVEPDNLPTGGTDNDAPQADDTAADWDYYDPDEDQDNEVTPEPEATDDGAAATDEEAEAEPQAEPEVTATVDAVVMLADGSKVKVQDLIQGQMRQEDYSRKTQEVANTRNALKAEVQRLEGITSAFIDHLSSLVPAAPDAALAMQNPGAFVAQKAQHEAALAKVQELIAIGEKPKEIKDGLTKQERDQLIAQENALLAQRFPETTNPQGRQKFLGAVAEAAENLGFSMDELGKVTDHRIFALAHYASLGMKAEKARSVAATKVAVAPPVAPKRPGQGAVAANRDVEAVKKFRANPSIRNAAAAWSGD